jgi:hypothetical protein
MVTEQLTQEANEAALSRIGAFDDKLIDRLSQNGLLGAFSDPGFQVSLKKAQLGAASTDHESDYEMLAELLEKRITRADERSLKAATDRAIEIIDKVEPAALDGLTTFYVAANFQPLKLNVNEGLDLLDRLWSQFISIGLPPDRDWLEHLDILDAVRVSQVATVKKFKEYFPGLMSGYSCPGLETGSDRHREARERLETKGLSIPEVEHELRPGYSRLAVSNLMHLEELLKNESGFTEEQKGEVIEVAKEYYKIDKVEEECRDVFMQAVQERPTLEAVREWWDQLPTSINVTAVGRLLALSNATRCDELNILPKLE